MFISFLPNLLAYLHNSCSNFQAGRVANNFSAWTKITNDKEILSDVLGVHIECTETPVQYRCPAQTIPEHEHPTMKQEIDKLIQKRVITTARYDPKQIISSIFLRPKKDGSYRLILNLKKFNESVTYHHFKMGSLCTITKLIAQNCFMAAIEMKDAYYSIPIRYSDRKFLRFQWDKVLYQFTCLPNGLCCAPRKFTKILKPLLANLHTKGHISVAYLDDLYLQGQTYDQCIANVIDTTLMLEELGFLVHPTKSVLIPTQEIIVLGFVINSVTMTVRLTQEKAMSLKQDCTKLIKCPITTIREVAKVIGKVVSSFPGVMYM